jgi:vacuolar-type H+-ATPase subunit E/Vma4
MQGFEKIVELIKTESEKECKEIAVNAHKECERIRAEYARKEQDAYWSHVNTGSKEIERRVEQLSNLAAEEAKKKVYATQQDMLDDTLALTARKLSALPSRKYNELLDKLGIDHGCKPEYLVEQFRDDLSETVISALFD